MQLTDERAELFYGFDKQFSAFGLRGVRVPIGVSEQWIGRGAFPTTRTTCFI